MTGRCARCRRGCGRGVGAHRRLPNPLWLANEYYGRSDIQEHAVKLSRSINFVMSNLQRIIKFHGHPKTWGQGFKHDELKIGVDETIVLPQKATLQNLEMLSDLSSSIELYARLKEALHQITQTPEVAAGKLESAGNLSGVALKILYGPLLAKTAVKRTLYGPLIQEIHRRTLDMLAGRRSDQNANPLAGCAAGRCVG